MALLRIGSRGSQLALWQAEHIAAQLRARGHEVRIEVIRTSGDKLTEVALSAAGTKGMFIKEIEEALAEGRVDLAVHSLKDLPTDLAPEFLLVAISAREDPHDVFVSARWAKLDELPQQARVGTSSLRRQAQLKAWRPDLRPLPLRGNVDTRLRKLEAGEFDAIILAAAGVKRLGRTRLVRQVLPVERMCPAPGQGALAIEVRRRDSQTVEQTRFIDHPSSRRATECERELLRTLGGGCQVPIGALAEIVDDDLRLTAVVASPDGSRIVRETRLGRSPEALGKAVGEKLLANGAAEILEAVYGTRAAAPQQP